MKWRVLVHLTGYREMIVEAPDAALARMGALAGAFEPGTATERIDVTSVIATAIDPTIGTVFPTSGKDE